MDFNKEKFKKLLHYIIGRCGDEGNVEKSVLCNLLYFSDFNFFELYEQSLTDETYRKLPHGPVPAHFDVAIDELAKEGKIKATGNISSQMPINDYASLKEPQLDFTPEELLVIDDVISELGNMNANQLIEYAQGDMPWKATDDNEIMDYGFVFYRNPEYVKREYEK